MAVEGYLRKIVVAGSFMKSVNLSPADLSGANFRNADLSRAILKSAYVYRDDRIELEFRG